MFPRSLNFQGPLFLVCDPKLDSTVRETLDPNSGNIWPWEHRTPESGNIGHLEHKIR